MHSNISMMAFSLGPRLHRQVYRARKNTWLVVQLKIFLIQHYLPLYLLMPDFGLAVGSTHIHIDLSEQRMFFASQSLASKMQEVGFAIMW